MAFINMQNVGLAFGSTRLFEEINLTIEQGEKVALVGLTCPHKGYHSLS